MSPDAPRIHLLRFRQLTVRRDLDWPDWVGTPAAVDEVAALWREVGSLVDWLADRVGPGADSAAR